MNLDSNYIKTEAAKPCYWLNDGVFNLPEWTRAMMQIAADRAGSKINSMKRDLDACRPYLKEGETPAECLARNRADIAMLMGKLGEEKMRSAKLRTTDMKDAARYRLLRSGQHWSVIDGIGDTLSAESLDASIDMEMTGNEVAG
jgi:hypothetical protein